MEHIEKVTEEGLKITEISLQEVIAKALTQLVESLPCLRACTHLVKSGKIIYGSRYIDDEFDKIVLSYKKHEFELTARRPVRPFRSHCRLGYATCSG